MTYFVQFFDGDWSDHHPSANSVEAALKVARRFHLWCADTGRPYRQVRIVDGNARVVVAEDDLRLAPPVRR